MKRSAFILLLGFVVTWCACGGGNSAPSNTNPNLSHIKDRVFVTNFHAGIVQVADLGLDEVLVYPIDAGAGGLAINDAGIVKLPPGSGPRHLVFRPDGKFVYVLNEIIPSVTSFRYIPQRGALEDPQTVSTLPEGYSGPKSGVDEDQPDDYELNLLPGD